MRRRQDGYVLVYVMVVILFLCVAAAAVCTVSLRNLKSQQASLAQMQSRYEAEGKIEQFTAQLKTASGEGEDGSAAKAAAINSLIERFSSDDVSFTWNEQSAEIYAESGDGSVCVSAVIAVEFEVIKVSLEGTEDELSS